MLPALAAVLLAALAAQAWALWGMGRRRSLGDEVGYLQRGGAADPYAPQLFLRVPLLPFLAAVCRGGAGRDAGERRLRLTMAAASWLAVAATAAAGWRLGGPPVAFLAALLLAVQPERVLLGCHIWPDTVLALVLAALAALPTTPGSPAPALAAGGLCAVGVLTRIDFLAALPPLLAAWWAAPGPASAFTAWALVAPPLLALSLVALRNGRRYGLPLPDTTWAFNVLVARSEARCGGERSFAIEPTVVAAASGWRGLTPAQGIRRALGALAELLRSPRRFGRGAVRRLLTLAGPDTFLRQKLLPREAAYPQLGAGARRRWDAALRIAFPLLLTVVLVAAAAGRRWPPSYAWPSLGLLLPAVLFHARTRYRLALMPALSLVAAEEIAHGAGSLAGRPLTAALMLAGGAAFLWALLRIRCSAELRAEPPP